LENYILLNSIFNKQTESILSDSRILVIMPSIPVQGMERANLQIMKMMHEKGADILFVTEGNHGGRLRKEIDSIGCKWENGLYFNSFDERLHLTFNIFEMSKVIRSLTKTSLKIKKICKNFKPTHIHITNLHHFIYSLPTLLLFNGKIIFRLPNPPDTIIQGWKRALHNFIWRFIVNSFCNTIICNSYYTKSELDKIGVKNTKTQVIYNCLPERVNHKKNDFPIIDKNRFNIVYLGRIKPEKGVNELFQVAKKIIQKNDGVDFYFAGENSWQNPFADRLIQEVNEKDLESRIHFLGEIEDVFGFLSICNLHVCPSTSDAESLPNVVIEAKSQGVTSVVFPTAGLPEMVSHMIDGFVCKDKTVESLYEGIIYFLENPHQIKKMGQAAMKSLEFFGRDKIEKEWVSVFKIFNL